MKKLFFFFVAVAALVLSASCNKDGKNSPVVLPATQYFKNAQKFILNESSPSNPGIKSIEFTESGRYLIYQQKGAVKAVAEPEYEYKRGTYTINDNGEYVLDNNYKFATVKVSGTQITINVGGQMYTPTVQEVVSKYPDNNEFYTTLARAWKVEQTDISVSFDGKTNVVYTFKGGCDIPAILKELEGKANVDLKDDKMAGYVVSEINFTMSKTIEVAFTQKPSVSGDITLSESGDFSYTLQGANDLEFFSGTAKGKIDTNPGLGANKILLSMDAEVSSQSKTYKGKVELILSPAE